ncbi:unnamed protein product [Chironomus riparius]|uniref:Uncharacterized protein n=1 Tax=Chironomus riparius TaxID=315576 RepID=A0A9N9WUY9_9DIPT|nr:unnamed protein product [Chironomus riparius]
MTASNLWVGLSKVIAIVNETFEDCTENGKIQMIDFSNLKFYNKDNEMYMNGDVVFKTEINSPFVVSMSIEQLKFNQWISSFLNRYVPDFCVQMKSKHEPWYQATKNMHDCPIPADSALTLNNVASGDFIKKIPDLYEGKNRFTVNYEIINGTKVHKECLRIYFDLETKSKLFHLFRKLKILNLFKHLRI